MRLIDADALIDDLKHDVAMDEDSLCHEDLTNINRANIQNDKDIKQNAIDLLKHAPTIEKRKKGRWIFNSFTKCSECGYQPKISSGWNFCPNCGADMRGELW